jgi:hypothetical protein
MVSASLLSLLLVLLVCSYASGFAPCSSPSSLLRGKAASSRLSSTRLSSWLTRKAATAPSGASDVAIAKYRAKWDGPNAASDADLAKMWGVMSRVYGEDDALKMIEIMPSVLGYNSENIEPSFKIFAEKFGDAQTRAMMKRNPALLSLQPTGFGSATGAKEDTLYLSYFIAATRPLGSAVWYVLGACISVPLIEKVTGVTRADLFSSFFN